MSGERMAAFRSALLLGILTAIFLAIGFFFGGIFGATAGLIIAFIVNFISYFFSDKIVLKMYNAKELKDEKINAMVEKLAKKSGLPKPKTYIIQTDIPNAFATGRNKNHAAVAVTKGLIDKLDDDEIEGVIAHEISHIKHKDTLISTMAATIAGAISWLAYIFWFGDERNRNIINYILLFVLAPIAAMLIRLAISRSREYYADRGAGEISNPLSLASALGKISDFTKNVKIKGNPSTAHLFIVNPFTGINLINLFSTHPPIEERIKRLEEMAKKK